MFYLSQLLGAPVEDQQAERLGKITDVLVLATQVGREEPTYPQVLLVADDEDHVWRIPIGEIARHDAAWQLRAPAEQFEAAESTAIAPTEVSLAHDVLDKQIIDIEHKKALRVSDVCFDDDWRILGIDHATLGLLRRLAPTWLTGLKNLPATLLPWSQVELIERQHPAGEEETAPPLTLPGSRAPSGHLAELHPADIA